jgi:hypothetical protein
MTIQDEFETVSRSDPLSRYRYFLNVVIDTAQVWTGRTEAGVLFSEIVEGRPRIPVFARQIFFDGWSPEGAGVIAQPIPLDEFIESEVVASQFSGGLVAVMPGTGDWGHLIEIPRFIKDLRMELDLIT